MDTYNVLKNFVDSKNNHSLHKEGETVKLTKSRGEELTERGFVEPVVSDEDSDETTKALKAVESKKGTTTKEEKKADAEKQ